MSITGDLGNKLLEELNNKTMFTIPVFGGLPVNESVVVTWIIMAVLTILSILLVRNLKVENPGKKQVVLEFAIDSFYKFFYGLTGEKGKRYIPYLITITIYIGVANVSGLIGFKPPTKDLNMTAALAVMSIILVEYAGIREKRISGWLKSFTEPLPMITPLNVLEIVIKPLSLCMRLFGNVLGAFVVMELIKQAAALIVPIPFSMYFDIFDGLLQAYVFGFLTALYINEAVE